MFSFLLSVALVTHQAQMCQELDSWPLDTVFEWEVNCWEWKGELDDKIDPIPKHARKVATLKLYEPFGRLGYASAGFGEEATIRVALVPRRVDRAHGLMTSVAVEVVRPQPQSGTEKRFRTDSGLRSVYTRYVKFGEQDNFAGTGVRDDEKIRAGEKTEWVVFSLTIRKCEHDKKKLIEDYFGIDGPPKRREEPKGVHTRPGPGEGDR
jgi:hypothetical protein